MADFVSGYISAFLGLFLLSKLDILCWNAQILNYPIFCRDLKEAFDEVSSEFDLSRAQQNLRANSSEADRVVSQSLGTFAMFGSVSGLVCGRNISGSPFTSGGQANR